MYLIHAQFRAPSEGCALPVDAAHRVLALARSGEGVEHVTAHPYAQPHPVLGLFLLASSLHEAEGRAAGVCRRLLREHRDMSGWALLKAEVPLLAPLGHGPLGPPGTPSTPRDLRRE
ncbi:hypothetical protein C0216_05385 [Streptomyces globosus]|uniref:Uncharacterized protein n=1 Tax=Streptomyces globosus TaxID=68209 RepID=A0A344TWE1_9ACTN|nr:MULTISPECIES: hypothetical protein [Streptomyces]AXE22962.1 hypothetical protein C0216_05385 [Streptomyces globosus]